MNFITVLVLVQYVFFGTLVAKARKFFKVDAPSMTGPQGFECVVRVHQNTLERVVVFLPLMWIAFNVWQSPFVAALGVVFFVGRMVYWKGYVQSPAKRMAGNAITMASVGLSLLLSVAGLVKLAFL
jgi:glutathione S-transferase